MCIVFNVVESESKGVTHMKTRISTTACTLTVGMLLALSSQAAIIYSDDFNFTGNLNGRTPTETTGGATWTADGTIWTSDGNSVTPGAPTRTAYLPFVPQTGMIYELSARMSNASGGTGIWVSLGFNQNAAPDVAANFTGNAGIGTVILRDNGNNQMYAGPAVSGASSNLVIPGYAADTFYEYKVVLNTMGANWTYDVYRDGTQLDVNGNTTAGLTYTWTSGNPTIRSVQLSSNTASGSARYDNFSLVAIPEPTSALSLVLAGALGLIRRRR